MTRTFTSFGAFTSRLASACANSQSQPATAPGWICFRCLSKRPFTSTARQPYLEHHGRKSRSLPQRPHTSWDDIKANEPKLSRSEGNVAVLEYSDLDNEVQREIRPSLRTVWDPRPIRGDHRAGVLQALRLKDPDRLLLAFLAAGGDLEFVREIPANTFTSILELLDPGYFLASFQKTQHEMRDGHIQLLRIRRAEDIASELLQVIQDVVKIRRDSGRGLSLADYRQLLYCARAAGSATAATAIWMDMISDGISPDGICFNHRMGAVVWNECYNSGRRHELRVTERYLRERSLPDLKLPHLAFRVGKDGILSHVAAIHAEMVSFGAQRDEDTFTLLMIAAAREGKVKEVAAIMLDVWNIDLEALEAGELPAQRESIPLTSSLYPSARLLFTAFHCLAINNLLPVALKVTDFISRTYSITISPSIWSNIFEWTYIFSKFHKVTEIRAGFGVGMLPPAALFELWATISGPPYNVQPTLVMYNRLIKSHFMLCEWREVFRLIYEVFPKHKAYTSCALADLREVEFARLGGAPRYALAPLRRRFRADEMAVLRNRANVRVWVRSVLRMTKHVIFPNEENWHVTEEGVVGWIYTEVPKMIMILWRYLPVRVRYEVPGGQVEFETRSAEEVAMRHEDRDRRLEKRAAIMGVWDEELDKVGWEQRQRWRMERQIASRVSRLTQPAPDYGGNRARPPKMEIVGDHGREAPPSRSSGIAGITHADSQPNFQEDALSKFEDKK